jgi:general L-amino acid transport system substrate-binding protein
MDARSRAQRNRRKRTVARRRARVLILATAILSVAAAAAADTLDEVRKRGYLRCGITESGPGFSYLNADGERAGFEIDHCKTIAAAVFGALNLELILVSPQTAFTLLQSGGIDIFPAGATWSFLRDASLGVDFTGVYFYDGQGFMVRRASGVRTVSDLDAATICVTRGTTLEQNLADYFDDHGLDYDLATFSDVEMAIDAYRADRCDAVTMQRAALAARAAALADRDAHVVLADLISKEPQAALVRQGDDRWRDIAAWAFNARILAEELGIRQANVEQMRAQARDPEVRRLLGVEGDPGAPLGLSADWAYHVIRLVGNYADVWDRNLAPIGLDRQLNALWSAGGLMVPLPFR